MKIETDNEGNEFLEVGEVYDLEDYDGKKSKGVYLGYDAPCHEFIFQDVDGAFIRILGAFTATVVE